jgi:hypothetical protein
MIDKRFWSGTIAVVTLIVAGAGALPELLLWPAPIRPTIVLPLGAPMAEPIAKPEQTAAVARSAAVPRYTSRDLGAANSTEKVGPLEQSIAESVPQPAAMVLEPPKPVTEVPTAPAPAPPVAFPPVQAVGVQAASVPDMVPPATNPQARPTNPPRPTTDKPVRSEPAQKPRQNVRPAAYPIGEFLAWRR